MNVPKNYRRLKPKETLRKGDIYIHFRHDNDGVMSNNDARLAADHWGTTYKFYRRRHIKTAPVTMTIPVKNDNRKPVTVVMFNYPSSNDPWYQLRRTVQMILLDDTYLVGLERTKKDGKYRYQFKKFRRDRIGGDEIRLIEYGQTV